MSIQNLLLITADDLTWSSVGFMGCSLPGLTPNVDRLAASGVVFEHGCTQTTVCMPSRQSLMTGRYPGNSGDLAEFHPIADDVPTLPAMLQDQGF